MEQPCEVTGDIHLSACVLTAMHMCVHKYACVYTHTNTRWTHMSLGSVSQVFFPEKSIYY